VTLGIARRFNARGYRPNRLEFGYWGAQSFARTVPLAGPYSVSLAGTDYSIDTSFEPYRREAFRHRSVPAMRESLNFDNVPGQGVVNTGGLWPRAQTDWSMGAGQQFLDHHRAVANRFYQSKGVNVWTEDQISLLPDTVATPYWSMQGTLKTWVKPLQVGKYQYFCELDRITWIDTTAPGTIHTVAGAPATAAGSYFTDITSNGQFVFVACGTNGVYYWPIGDSATAGVHYVQQTSGATTGQMGYTITGVAWCADQLWASGQQYLYVFGSNTTIPSRPPSINGAPPVTWAATGGPISAAQMLPQVVGAGWVWTNIVEGNSQIYVGGYNHLGGGVVTDGSIYRISQVLSNTIPGSTTTTSTTYAAPTKSLQLTPGEYPTTLFNYLNFIFIGTNYGVRMGETLNVYDPTATGTGDLKAGALIPNIVQPVSFPVTSFTAQGRWLYFVWGNYDGTSTGIGRMDITKFIDDLAPVYASDLMVTAQLGAYSSASYGVFPGGSNCFLMWDTIQNAPMIAVCNPTSGTAGCYSQRGSVLVASGTMNAGILDYDVPDFKCVVSIESFVLVDAGSVNFTMQTDYGNGTISAFNTICQQSAAANTLGTKYWLPTPVRGLKFDLVVQLVRDPNSNTLGPVLDGWLMQAFPAVTSETTITPVLSLFRSTSILDQAVYYEPYFEYFRLDQLRRSQSIVTYQEGPLSALVLIRGIDWLPEKLQDPENKGYNSVAVVSLETINGFTYTPIPTHT